MRTPAQLFNAQCSVHSSEVLLSCKVVVSGSVSKDSVVNISVSGNMDLQLCKVVEPSWTGQFGRSDELKLS